MNNILQDYMVNNHKELYINITHLKKNVLLRYKIPNFTRDNNITVLGGNPDLETTKKSILDIEKKYQPEEIYLSSIKSKESSDEIYLKEYLEALCDMLNQGKEEEEKIFKLVT